MKHFIIFLLILPQSIFSQTNTKAKLSENEIMFNNYLDSSLKSLDAENYHKAIEMATMAIRLNTKDPFPYLIRGKAQNQIGQKELALIDYNSYIKIDPKDADAFCERANIAVELNQLSNAFQDYTMAISLGTKSKYLWYYYYRRALFRESLLDWLGCIADCNKSIQNYIKDELDIVYILRSRANLESGNFVEALNDANKALQIQPVQSSFWVYYTRGLAKVKLGNKESACTDFYKAKELQPDYRLLQTINQYCK
jgi:tetratricopeptide (TPR) repeat protein